ncbi:MAG: Ppx/GppA family phosphatase [Burkholderiaceae bacterium]|jgi:exopolyphosphatase/guanosine-5'-triphosphate,3'-diphosphate pyrophosphatase|nr:Ppx/GppA family phosphatase [Burkholderiaceae bacterium]
MQLAAVDLGSNSFRLQMGRGQGNHVELQGYWKETVRLAAGVGGDGRISRRAVDAACDCLARMNERLRGLAPGQVRAVGTQTLREAPNSDEFLLEAQQALGYPIDIISGREEARLTFEGCMHSAPPSSEARLVVDIGGASTELIVGSGFEAQAAESFKVGCVNTTLRFFRDGVIDRNSMRKAQVAAAAEIEEAVNRFSRANWHEAFGASGTVGAAAELVRQVDWGDGSVITAGMLLNLRQLLIEYGEVRKLKLPGIKPERAEVLPGGIAVLGAVFDTLGITEMVPARGGLRLGLLYDLLGRRERRDLRDATVSRLQKRFDVDRGQAQWVGRIARELHDALDPQAGEEEVKRLAWAAALHEVGFAISHNDHHKHGAYLVGNADLAGFSTTDQQRIATLVLAQRGNLRKVGEALQDPARVAKILALRLAVIFCHARRPVTLPKWTLRAGRSGNELRLDGDWLARHPLTQFLLEEEAAQWDKVGRRLAVRAL